VESHLEREHHLAVQLGFFMAADWVTGEVTDVNGGYFID